MSPFIYLLSRIEQTPTGQVHRAAAEFLAAGAAAYPTATFRVVPEYGDNDVSLPAENPATVALSLVSPSDATTLGKRVRKFIELLGAGGAEA